MKKTWIAFALMACLSFAACGNGGGTDGGDDGDNGSEAVSPAVGTWVMDTDSALKMLTDNPPEGMPPQALAPITNMIKAMKGTMTVNADGTYEGLMEMPNPMTGEISTHPAKGTWTLEGDKFTITTTEQDGEVQETPDTEVAVMKDGVITITPDGAPFSIFFKKK